MDSRIEELEEKFWNAESSLDEEQELKQLVQQAPESAELSELKQLFAHHDEAAQKQLDDSFDEEILAIIQAEKEEVKVVSFNDYFRKYSAIAAAVLVTIISSVFFYQQQNAPTSTDTFETPEEAYAELKKQLLMVSVFMNKGNNTMSEFGALGDATDELGAIGNMSSAESGLQMLGGMSVN
ncbi:hypothetical protein [Roseivirga pacifica]|uniref:hypothetical protein n=1 Tax=Roseivirga pacifica TaxID=1267423 RepID=UPI003BAC193D